MSHIARVLSVSIAMLRCAGKAASLACNLAYGAPEVVAACTAGQRTIEAAPSMDVWSLGVLA